MDIKKFKSDLHDEVLCGGECHECMMAMVKEIDKQIKKEEEESEENYNVGI